jgi:IS66 C-terminal element
MVSANESSRVAAVYRMSIGVAWARMASLIETCKLNLVIPQSYFTDVLTRLVDGWPQSRIDELMPWHWATQQVPLTIPPLQGRRAPLRAR